MERLTIRYIDELNAFDAWLETNEISTAAVALWYALMQIANKTGWKKTFNATNGILSVKTGGLSVPALHRARTALQSAGRISFRTRKGKQATEYTIIPFTSSVAYRIVKQTDQVTDQVTDQRTVHIPRLDKTRLDKTSSTIPLTKIGDGGKMVIREYQNKISPVSSPKEQELLLDAIQHFSPGWVSRAIDVAAEYNAHSVQYVLSVLRRWEKEGGTDDGASRSNGRQNRKDAASSRKKSRGNTVRTDWSDVPTSWDDVKI